MIRPITETEHGITIGGKPLDILMLTRNLREVYHEAGRDMPQTLSDLVFNLEVALQNFGILDENFNVITRPEMRVYTYVERDENGAVIFERIGRSIEEVADFVGFDHDEAADFWAGAEPGKPVIDEEVPGEDGNTYTREFHIS